MNILRLLLHGLLGLTLFCAAGQVQAEGLTLKGLNLDLSLPQGRVQTGLSLNYRLVSPQETERIAIAPNPCAGGVETEKYTHAQHHEGPSRRFLNENIGGVAYLCYPWKNDNPFKTFVLVGAMTNSQFQQTFFFGPGFRLNLPNIGNLTPYVGGKAPFVIYELWQGHGAVQGILPTAFVGLSYALSETLHIEAFKEWLPKGGVKIYGVSSGIRSASSAAADDYRYQSLSNNSWSEGRPRPTLALQLSFQFF